MAEQWATVVLDTEGVVGVYGPVPSELEAKALGDVMRLGTDRTFEVHEVREAGVADLHFGGPVRVDG